MAGLGHNWGVFLDDAADVVVWEKVVKLVQWGDLLMKEKGYEYNLEKAGTYLNLREETFWGEKKLKM